MAKPTSERRGGPVDVIKNTRGSGETGWAGGEPGVERANADKDYFSGIKKFSNYPEQSSAEPNRGKGNESGQKP